MKINALLWADIEPYLRKARRQSVNTCSKYKSCFKYLQLWYGEKELNDKTFSNFLFDLEQSGISPAHQNNYIKFVKHLASYLEIYQEFIKFPLNSVPDSTPEYILTNREIEKLATVRVKYQKYKDRKFKHKALILFLGNVGSRLDETLQLRIEDLIPKPVNMVHFRKETTKTKRERFCPIPEWLYKLLMELPREGNLVFTKIDAANFRCDLALRSELCKIPIKVKPSTFRDSSINNKLSYGMPIQEVGAYHGHVKIDTTFKYYTLIQAGQMAKTLQQFDPAYDHDSTFETVIDNVREVVEKRVNTKVAEFISKSIINNGRKEVWFGLVEKRMAGF